MTLLGLGVAFTAGLGLYALVMGRAAGRVPPERQRRHLVVFTLGLLLTLVIFIPSPDLFGPEYRFTVSMAQMLLAVDLTPPLLLRGFPSVLFEPAAWKDVLSRPQTALYSGAISTAVLWTWFLPPLFEAASGSLGIWLLKQALLLVSGLIMWWPVFGLSPEYRPVYPIQLVYLLVMRIPMAALGIGLSFATRLVYTARSFALELCAPSSVADQQLGGLIMWMVGGMSLLAAFFLILSRWLDRPNYRA
jgi:putative membrane protein